MFESNCLFLRRSLLCELGGADERFDFPGGGFVNLDLFKRAIESPGVTPVQLIGEGSFHQLHGGTTTNVTPEQRDLRVLEYKAQYRELRGSDIAPLSKNLYYMGHLPTLKSKIHMRKPRIVNDQESQKWEDIVRER